MSLIFLFSQEVLPKVGKAYGLEQSQLGRRTPQYFCPRCHPWGRQSHIRAAIKERAFGWRSNGDQKPAAKKKKKRSPPRRQKNKTAEKRQKQSPPLSTEPPSDPSDDSPSTGQDMEDNKVNAFICHLAEKNVKTNKQNWGPDEQFDGVCDAFAKKCPSPRRAFECGKED